MSPTAEDGAATHPAAAPTVRRRDVRTPDGGSIVVWEAGDPSGPPVLLLHGLSFSAAVWTRQLHAPRLAGLRLIAPDLRGHGHSGPAGPAGFRRQLWAADLAAIVDDLAVTDLAVVAWSYGAIVLGCYLQASGPGPVTSVSLVAPGSHCGSAVALEDLSGAGADPALTASDADVAVPALSAFVRACAAPTALAPDDEALLLGAALRVAPATRAAMLAFEVDHRPLWAALALPLSVLYGTEDAIIAPASSARLAASHPDASVQRFAGSGHMPFWSVPDRFATHLLRLAAPAE